MFDPKQIKAFTFDTGGTVLDWHTGFKKGFEKLEFYEKSGFKSDEMANLFRKKSLEIITSQGDKELVNFDDRVSSKNPLFTEVDQPEIGTYLTPGSPLQFQNLNPSSPIKAPALGENTNEILEEILGLSPKELGALRDREIVQ